MTARVAYSALDDEWKIDAKRSTYTSPAPGDWYQRLIFNEPFRFGRISADIKIDPAPREPKPEDTSFGSLIFRFSDRDNYYYAGIGGFGARFFIGMMYDNKPRVLAKAGFSDSIRKGDSHSIQVRTVGNHFTLIHNGITQLSVIDDTFSLGPWGLQSYYSIVEFANVAKEAVKPTCFVIMPFGPQFDAIYKVIHETLESQSYGCIRADQRYLTGPIIEGIFDQIERADLVIADFTDKNPNVFYEAGYAKALRKPTVQIAQSMDDLPFDVRHLRTFSYNTRILGDRELANKLREAIKAASGFEPISPMGVPSFA